MSLKSIQPKLLIIVLALYVPVLALLGLISLVNLYTGIPLENFTRDPAAIAGVNPFTGIVSDIGILFWCTGASICLFGFLLNVTHTPTKKTNDFSLFLLFFGLITLALLLDNLFLFHELIAPKILNLAEEQIYLAYGIAVILGIVRFRKIIFTTEWIILGLSFAFFFLSIAMDIIVYFPISSVYDFWEDGFKLLGIVSWVYYLVLSSWQIVKQSQTKYEIKQKITIK